MKLGIRRALVVGLVALGVFLPQAVPAGATVNIGVAVVTGSGSISPGLHELPTGQQSFTFSSVLIGALGVGHPKPTVITPLDPSTCGAFGLDGITTPLDKGSKNGWPGDSKGAGTGLGVWGCTAGPLAGKGGLLYYTRVGTVVTVTLTKGAKPLETVIGGLVCNFVPDQLTGLVTSYTLTCVGWLLDVLAI